MRDEFYQEIKEAGWRRALNGDEEAALQRFLAAHPEARQAWGEEAALNRLLQRWPAPPVSSNFTARLLQAAQNAPARRPWRDWLAPAPWLPEGRAWRVAMCSMMVCLGLFCFRESQVIHRARMARELAGVSRLAALPPMEWLKDFDTINGISRVKLADDDLLAALE
jgi:anti-sigma factor RsiW